MGERAQVEAIARAMALANLTTSTVSTHWRTRARGGASHPVFARVWARMAARVGSERQRATMLAGLHGRVVEIEAGEGRNFALYPSQVSEVLAIEPEPYLRQLAEQAALHAPVQVKVVDGIAEAIPTGDGECDAVVSSLVLCSVGDQPTTVAELHRVLKPRGQLRFFEHIRARHPLGIGIQVSLDRSGLWPRLGAGCHLSRDTLAAMRTGGFSIDAVTRSSSGPGNLGIPFVLGTATKID